MSCFILRITCCYLKILKYKKLNFCLLIGGTALIDQDKLLNKGVDILIATPGRLIDHINRGNILFNDLKINSISSDDRFMFCGSMGLNNDLKKIMLENNFHEGANNHPGNFVLEKAFVS